ncbi:hypothetical protein HG531_005719 [Fusarium graminearum]|nr:hypothetical protein HG531_005719 [Fusarium graminearum]
MLSKPQRQRCKSQSRVGLWTNRHDRKIAHPKVLNTLDLEIRVNHSILLGRTIHAHRSTLVRKHTKAQVLRSQSRVGTEFVACCRGLEGLRINKSIPHITHNIFHGALDFMLERVTSEIKHWVQARNTENRVPICEFSNKLKQHTNRVKVLLLIGRASSKEEVGVDGDCDKTFFSTDLEMSLEIERFLCEAAALLLGESRVANIVVNKTLADEFIRLLQAAVEGNGCGTNCTSCQYNFGFSDAKFFESTSRFISDLECTMTSVLRRTDRYGSLAYIRFMIDNVVLHDAKLGLFQSMVELLFGKSNVLSTDFVSTITLGIDTIPWIIVGQVLVSICVAPFLEILHNLRREVSIEGLVANLWNPSAPEISTAADTIDRPTDIAVRGIGQLNFGFDSVINTLVALWGVAGTAFVKGTRSVEDVGGEDDAAAFNQQHLFLLGSQVFSQWTSAKPTSYNDVVIGVEFGQETHDVCV